MKKDAITLLDGSSWSKKELMEKMRDDNFYYGYMGRATLSSSAVKMLADSPKVYQYHLNGHDIEGAALDVGGLVHHMILEPEKVEDYYVTVDVSSRQTNAFKDAKNSNSAKTVITRKEYEGAERCSLAARKNPHIMDALNESIFETPVVGEISGLPFRAKADLLSSDGERMWDIKTTSDVKSFRKSAHLYCYNAQAYIYCSLFNVKPENYKYLVVDKGSYDIGVFSVSEEFMMSGEALVNKAINNYLEYFVRGVDLNSYTIQETL